MDRRDAPGFNPPLADFHSVLPHVQGHGGHVQEVVGEILLDHVADIAAPLFLGSEAFTALADGSTGRCAPVAIDTHSW